MTKLTKYYENKKSEVNFHSIDTENADITHLAYLSACKEFHTTHTLIEIISKRNTIIPVLYLAVFSPKTDVYRVASLKHFRNVDMCIAFAISQKRYYKVR